MKSVVLMKFKMVRPLLGVLTGQLFINIKLSICLCLKSLGLKAQDGAIYMIFSLFLYSLIYKVGFKLVSATLCRHLNIAWVLEGRLNEVYLGFNR